MNARMIYKTFPAQVKVLDDASRRVQFIISTGDVDLENERVDPRGWQLDDYRANAIVLWAHNHQVPAIGRTVEIGLEGAALKATIEFPPLGLHPLADQIYGLIKAGFPPRSASVGFDPERWSINAERGGRDYHEQTLREWSIVNLPALPQAAVDGARGAAAAVEKWLKAACAPCGSGVDLNADAGIELIEYDAAAIARLARAVGEDDIGLEAIGYEAAEVDELEGISAADVAVALREVIRQEVAAGLRRAVNSALGRID